MTALPDIPAEHRRVVMLDACRRCGGPCYRLRATMEVACAHPGHHGPRAAFIPHGCLAKIPDAEVDAALAWMAGHEHHCPTGVWVGHGRTYAP